MGKGGSRLTFGVVNVFYTRHPSHMTQINTLHRSKNADPLSVLKFYVYSNSHATKLLLRIDSLIKKTLVANRTRTNCLLTES